MKAYIYPSLIPVTTTYTLRSNLNPSTNSGSAIYYWTTHSSFNAIGSLQPLVNKAIRTLRSSLWFCYPSNIRVLFLTLLKFLTIVWKNKGPWDEIKGLLIEFDCHFHLFAEMIFAWYSFNERISIKNSSFLFFHNVLC